MAGDFKSGWGHGLETGYAAGQLVNLAALLAVEMVVVFFTGQFVPGGFARQFDRGQPAFLHQGLDVAVDGGDPDAFVSGCGEFEHLIGVEGPVGGNEGIADGSPLASVAIRSGFRRGHAATPYRAARGP